MSDFFDTANVDIYAVTDTDTDNASLPDHRRWVWYCKLRSCPDYYKSWISKTNFLLHLAETSVHRDDPSTKTRKGRQDLAEAWKEETTFDLSEPKKRSPEEVEKTTQALHLTGDAAAWRDFFGQDTERMKGFGEWLARGGGNRRQGMCGW
ncbi:hypothetical protein SPI_03434 [Niveomyces insectorum RCEF 264]|uniref:Uncharacterized protein n=1 Tax=Niveomyces insectorum RCEF 264 TaxID=1081102 RepID=A0A167W2Y1_9HYPO|nr:hypothetical protein SPI_03434 [Niveomyces insectorum RCEF 264]